MALNYISKYGYPVVSPQFDSENDTYISVYVDDTKNRIVLVNEKTNVVEFTIGGVVTEGSGTGSSYRCGNGNCSSGNFSTALGTNNTSSGQFSAVLGGGNNTASGFVSVATGGSNNTSSNQFSVVGGGFINNASGFNSTVAGGQNNIASNNFSAILGGVNNTANGLFSAILGGVLNNMNSQPRSMIVGSNITADRACTTFVNALSMKNAPTQANLPLPAGTVYVDTTDGNRLKMA